LPGTSRAPSRRSGNVDRSIGLTQGDQARSSLPRIAAALLGEAGDQFREQSRPEWSSTHPGIRRYASVFYSPYQLLALKPAEELMSMLSAALAANGKPRFSLRPLTPGEASVMDGGRQLAVLPSALDMHYLPPILLTAHHAHAWEREEPDFEAPLRLGMFGLAPEAIAVSNCHELL
jgi:hypothetical protein